jgi:hypothetical protein
VLQRGRGERRGEQGEGNGELAWGVMVGGASPVTVAARDKGTRCGGRMCGAWMRRGGRPTAPA